MKIKFEVLTADQMRLTGSFLGSFADLMDEPVKSAPVQEQPEKPKKTRVKQEVAELPKTEETEAVKEALEKKGIEVVEQPIEQEKPAEVVSEKDLTSLLDECRAVFSDKKTSGKLTPEQAQTKLKGLGYPKLSAVDSVEKAEEFLTFLKAC